MHLGEHEVHLAGTGAMEEAGKWLVAGSTFHRAVAMQQPRSIALPHRTQSLKPSLTNAGPYRTSSTAATSTATLNGSEPDPTANRA